METIKPLSARLNELLNAQHKTMSDLARACCVTPQAAQQWLRGSTTPRGSKMSDIASFFGISVVELMFGGADPHTSAEQIDRNVEPLADTGELVPLISFVQAGNWCEATDVYNVGDAEEWLPCPVKHGPKTYALRVRGLSMFNPGDGPSFKDGDIIFCDPDREAMHKSLIITRLDDSKEATFKRLLIDDSNRYLEALNPSWPNRIFGISQNATICGVVIARLETFI